MKDRTPCRDIGLLSLKNCQFQGWGGGILDNNGIVMLDVTNTKAHHWHNTKLGGIWLSAQQ
jgi:hypothetical protein